VNKTAAKDWLIKSFLAAENLLEKICNILDINIEEIKAG